MKWITDKPDEQQGGGPCLVTTLCNGGRRIVQRGWYGWGEAMARTIAYMPYPVFDPKNMGLWKSEYRGDELPAKSDHYIVAVQMSYGIRTMEGFVWFNATRNSFGGGVDIIAWHPIPKPYTGTIIDWKNNQLPKTLQGGI